MKRFLAALGITAIALAIIAGVAAAQGSPRGGHLHGPGMRPGMGPGMGPGHEMGMHGPPLERLAGALDLSDAQRTSLDGLHAELTATVEPPIDQKHSAMRQLHDSVEAGTSDACALGQLVLQAHANDAAIKAAHDRFEAGLVALLSPEQKSKYEAIKALRPPMRRGPRDGGEGDDAPLEG